MFGFQPGYWPEMPFREFMAWQKRADRQAIAEGNEARRAGYEARRGRG